MSPLSLVIFLLFNLIGRLPAMGASAPEIIVTWKTNSFTPSSYMGKALPSARSQINVALQLLDEDKMVNLSKNEIRWYINNQLLDSGSGLTNISFPAPSLGEQSLLLRVVIIDYKNDELNEFVTIPIIKPEIVIVSAEQPQLKSLAYFFNISSVDQLKIDWKVDGKTITVRAQNLTNPLENAQASIFKK